MIPVQLERLILCEDAVFKTAAIGQSGVSVIPVPEKVFIVIINFTYFGFIDFTDPTNVEANMNRSVHQLNFESPKSQNHFIIRDDTFTQLFAPSTNVSQVSGHYQEENLYLIHEADVKVEIVAAPQVAGSVSTAAIAPQSLKPPDPPKSYGSDPVDAIAATANYVDGAGSSEYIPLTKKFTTPLGATPFLVSQNRFPVTLATVLNPTFNGSSMGQRSYPIVNIGYVQVRRQLGAELLSTG